MIPNLRCERVEDRHQFGRIGAFGISLKALELKVSNFGDRQSLIHALQNCRRLEELTLCIGGCPNAFFMELFQLPFNDLRKHIIFSVTSRKHIKVLISQLRNLEELHLSLLPAPAVYLLPDIISANPFLNDLQVKEFRSRSWPKDTETEATSFFERLMECRPLRQIAVDMCERLLPNSELVDSYMGSPETPDSDDGEIS